MARLPLPPPPEAPTDAEEELLSITFSDLATLAQCGAAYRLRHLIGFQPRLVPELGYGRAVHHVVRRRVWAVERPFELHLPSAVVSGRAGVILDEENGVPTALGIVDDKTATDPTQTYDLQLQVCTDAGRREGLDVRAAYVHDLRAADRSSVDVSAGQSPKPRQRSRRWSACCGSGYSCRFPNTSAVPRATCAPCAEMQRADFGLIWLYIERTFGTMKAWTIGRSKRG